MARTIAIDPLTRIEGHLAFKVEVEEGRVSKAFVSGKMFRGFEAILRGRDPLDAQQITQRICGVCPIEHGIASVLAQDMAYGITPANNGRLVRNLLEAANFIASHIVHFYQLCALDFVDITAILGYQGKDPELNRLKGWVQAEVSSKVLYPAAPFLPRYEGNYIQDPELNIGAIRHYLQALEMRTLAHRMGAIFGGKLPHVATLVPGGVTETVTADKIGAFTAYLKTLLTFIDNSYLPDVVAVAGAYPEYFTLGKGCGNFLAYGVFHESAGDDRKLFPAGVIIGGKLQSLNVAAITEDVGCSLFSSPSGLTPAAGATEPAPHKSGAYSWLKAPRYDGHVMEVGALARVLVAWQGGKDKALQESVGRILAALAREPGDLVSVMGRHAARAIEAKLVAERALAWVNELTPDKPAFTDFQIPESARGCGLTEAARGALGHWIDIKGHKIHNYQCVVPTTWNCSPRDDRGVPGAVEQALVGTPIADPENPIEAARVVRSFDPCIACAVH